MVAAEGVVMRAMLGLTVMLLASLASAAETGLLKPVGGPGAGETKDGLQVTLKAVKTEFGPGESLLMQCSIANMSEQVLTLRTVKDRLNGQTDFKLTLRRDGRELAFTPRADNDTPVRVEKTLAPGAKVEFWLDLRAMHADAADRGPFKDLGSYEASVMFAATGARSGWAVFSIAEAGTPRAKPRDAAEAEKIRSLIAQLGDDNFDKREAAEKELVVYGEVAIDLLKQAMGAQADAETRTRCQRILARIEAALKQRQNTNPLCTRCQNLAFTADVGTCQSCQGHTPSGGWSFCGGCAVRRNQCAACAQALGAVPPNPPAPPIEVIRPRPRPRPRPQPAPEPQPAPIQPPGPPEEDF